MRALPRVAFPDVDIALGELIAEEGLVAGTWVATGTQLGELVGIPASGKQVTISGTGIDRVRDGKIVESRANWDALGMLGQLGAAPV